MQVTQFGHVNYLILTLAVGALGFIASLLTDNNHTGQLHPLYRCSLIMFGLSVAFGILCTITRLCDFRKTAEIARLRNKSDRYDSTEEIKKLRCETKILGVFSWCLLWLQIGLFTGGSVFLVIALV